MKKRISILALLLIGMLFSGCEKKRQEPLPQDRLSVDWSWPTNAVHVGDQVALVMDAYYPTNGILELPEIGRQKEVVLLDRKVEEIARKDALKQSRVRFLLTSFRLGEHLVSSNASVVCRTDEKTFKEKIPPFTLKVVSALSDDASSEIADIKPTEKLPGRIPPWLWIALGVALIAFLVGVLSARMKQGKVFEKPAPPPIPPHIRALQALDELAARGLLEKDECDPFYTALSAILRDYLEGRFRLNAPDETTEEIVEELSRSPELTGAQRNILQEFLRQADIVKFAKGHPDRNTMESAFSTTKQFVEQTKLTDAEDLAAKEHKERNGEGE
jgi:hypothetical protein